MARYAKDADTGAELDAMDGRPTQTITCPGCGGLMNWRRAVTKMTPDGQEYVDRAPCFCHRTRHDCSHGTFRGDGDELSPWHIDCTNRVADRWRTEVTIFRSGGHVRADAISPFWCAAEWQNTAFKSARTPEIREARNGGHLVWLLNASGPECGWVQITPDALRWFSVQRLATFTYRTWVFLDVGQDTIIELPTDTFPAAGQLVEVPMSRCRTWDKDEWFAAWVNGPQWPVDADGTQWAADHTDTRKPAAPREESLGERMARLADARNSVPVTCGFEDDPNVIRPEDIPAAPVIDPHDPITYAPARKHQRPTAVRSKCCGCGDWFTDRSDQMPLFCERCWSARTPQPAASGAYREARHA